MTHPPLLPLQDIPGAHPTSPSLPPPIELPHNVPDDSSIANGNEQSLIDFISIMNGFEPYHLPTPGLNPSIVPAQTEGHMQAAKAAAFDATHVAVWTPKLK